MFHWFERPLQRRWFDIVSMGTLALKIATAAVTQFEWLWIRWMCLHTYWPGFGWPRMHSYCIMCFTLSPLMKVNLPGCWLGMQKVPMGNSSGMPSILAHRSREIAAFMGHRKVPLIGLLSKRNQMKTNWVTPLGKSWVTSAWESWTDLSS